MYKSEAIRRVDLMIEEDVSLLCPILGDFCKTTCSCYQTPYYDCNAQATSDEELEHLSDLDVWFVSAGGCTAYALKGPQKGGD